MNIDLDYTIVKTKILKYYSNIANIENIYMCKGIEEDDYIICIYNKIVSYKIISELLEIEWKLLEEMRNEKSNFYILIHYLPKPTGKQIDIRDLEDTECIWNNIDIDNNVNITI